MKPDGAVFDAQWRESCQIKIASKVNVDHMVRSHYLAKWPAVCTLILAMLHRGLPVGCVIYALPPRETDIRYGGKTWELARLWVEQSVPKNAETWLISQSVKMIRRDNPDVRFLVSYADPSFGHCGTIYKAANWRCDDQTDGDRKTPRFDLATEHTDIFGDTVTKKWGRLSHVPVGEVTKRIHRVSKFRFYYEFPKRKITPEKQLVEDRQIELFTGIA